MSLLSPSRLTQGDPTEIPGGKAGAFLVFQLSVLLLAVCLVWATQQSILWCSTLLKKDIRAHDGICSVGLH